MWTCSQCKRIFKSVNQPHSCRSVPLATHFKGKGKAKEIFDYLVEQITDNVGKCKIISIPCCIHLFGKYDFLAALPKKDRLEIRIALNRQINSPRTKVSVPLSTKNFKNCFDIYSIKEVDEQFLNWIKESYFLRSNEA